MLPQPAQPTAGPQDPCPRHRDHVALIGAVVALRAHERAGVSVRSSARRLRVPRTTLRRAQRRIDAMGGGPDARAFFDGSEGQYWLHGLLVVLLLVVVLQGGAGVERVQFILKSLGLDKRIACSRSHLPERVITMSAMIRDFGVETTLPLCAKLGGQVVNLVADEMWLAGTMVLVALDPVSGWICVQKTALKRDGATWTREVQHARRGMSITIRTVGADCAKGLIHMALTGLGVSHSADLFHG